MKRKEVIELKKVPLAESYPPENMLPEDGLYLYLLQPSTREPLIGHGLRRLTY